MARPLMPVKDGSIIQSSKETAETRIALQHQDSIASPGGARITGCPTLACNHHKVSVLSRPRRAEKKNIYIYITAVPSI